MLRTAILNNNIHPKLIIERINHLRSKKIFTVFDFLLEDAEKLMKYTNLSFQEVLDIKQIIKKLYGGAVKTGLELLNTARCEINSTGIHSLDQLLDGGLRSGEVYEICGSSASGKSQLCHTIAVNFTQRFCGPVCYVDTKRDFSASRVYFMLESKKCHDEERARVMDLLKVVRVKNVQELLNVLHEMKNCTSESDNGTVPLVIIDSLPAIFFQSKKTSNYAYDLNHLSNIMRFLCSRFGVIFLLVNLITRWREADGLIVSVTDNPEITKSTLGRYWSVIPNTRLLLEVLKPKTIQITIWKSSQIAVGSTCRVGISNLGIV